MLGLVFGFLNCFSVNVLNAKTWEFWGIFALAMVFYFIDFFFIILYNNRYNLCDFRGFSLIESCLLV